MTYTGRLTLLNSVINSLPMFAMCSLKVPITIFIHFEKSGRQFLWADKEDRIQGKCLANWDMVCRPKDQGGLNVINLRIHNKALMMKNLHKFYNNHDIPWVHLLKQAHYSTDLAPHACSPKGSFWWKDCMKHNELFREHTICMAHKGDTILLWKDMWQESIGEDDYPHLFSFAKDPSISILKARDMINEDIYDLFNLALLMEAQAELDDLQIEANDYTPSQSHDEWSFPWGNKFSTSKLYRVLIGDHIVPKPILDIWKTCIVPRQKFFSWLLLNGKLNSKEMMLKKNFYVEFTD
jgi:hypothetical protein